MKPLRYASGEVFRDDTFSRTRHAFDHLYLEPKDSFAYRVSAKLPKADYPEDGPFGNGPLLKSIGNFAININKVLDRDNQIAVHIPDPFGRSVYVHGDNILTTHHVKESIEAILDAYAENHEDKDFNPHDVAAPTLDRTRRILDCLMAFTSASFVELPKKIIQPSLPSMMPEQIIARYLNGTDLSRLANPEKDTVLVSFDLDAGFKEVRSSEFEQDESNNRRTNMLYFKGEKNTSPETNKAFEEYWNIALFDGVKAESFKRLQKFIQSNLSVNVKASDYNSSTIELRGHPDAVKIAERIGKRAVPMLNESKLIDTRWLQNALSDAKAFFELQSRFKALGVLPIIDLAKPPRKDAEPKTYPEFHFSTLQQG